MAETRPPEGGPTADVQGGEHTQHDVHNENPLSHQTSATTLPNLDEEGWTYEKQLKVSHHCDVANARPTRQRSSREVSTRAPACR